MCEVSFWLSYMSLLLQVSINVISFFFTTLYPMSNRVSSRFVHPICKKLEEEYFGSIRHACYEIPPKSNVETSITRALEPIYGLTMHFVSSPVIGTYALGRGKETAHTNAVYRICS